ncbi:hypothetical protein BDQ12DRAFT_679720 [Crucibulum laeve]|uniref:Uncharacterized protein n=1 Tax=Crucibulum laeve TaxID=68775 RepID=A0A5C3M597_9AGAR|nr:hypothetical protein BDQ12DRAFT_679720 [Crucibulum laeve]
MHRFRVNPPATSDIATPEAMNTVISPPVTLTQTTSSGTGEVLVQQDRGKVKEPEKEKTTKRKRKTSAPKTAVVPDAAALPPPTNQYGYVPMQGQYPYGYYMPSPYGVPSYPPPPTASTISSSPSNTSGSASSYPQPFPYPYQPYGYPAMPPPGYPYMPRYSPGPYGQPTPFGPPGTFAVPPGIFPPLPSGPFPLSSSSSCPLPSGPYPPSPSYPPLPSAYPPGTYPPPVSTYSSPPGYPSYSAFLTSTATLPTAPATIKPTTRKIPQKDNGPVEPKFSAFSYYTNPDDKKKRRKAVENWQEIYEQNQRAASVGSGVTVSPATATPSASPLEPVPAVTQSGGPSLVTAPITENSNTHLPGLDISDMQSCREPITHDSEVRTATTQEKPEAQSHKCTNCSRKIPLGVASTICEKCKLRFKKHQAKAKQRFKLEPRKSLIVHLTSTRGERSSNHGLAPVTTTSGESPAP